MHIERLHKMMECLTEKALAELESGVEHIDTCEFGAVTDILKDLAEAEYYAKISVAMDEADTEEIMDMFDRYGDDRRYYDHYRYKNGRFAPKGRGTRRGYEEYPYYHMMPSEYDPEHWRDLDRSSGRLYYPESTEKSESRYDKAKRMYTETKEMHKANTAEDKQAKLKSLESYTKELAEDITELIADMSAEEKNMLRTKVQTLAQRIQ